MTDLDNNQRTNRLSHEKSPYLQQHANNPVDWYAWNEEAFEKAKREDKPIFLSIGYSTCHWCHVMAHESFEDDDVANLLNESFVNIKVDREERPDIDGVYMQVAQMMTGSGGWPLTIIMTPDKQPFFAGTYIPKESRQNILGLVDLIPRISNIWKKDRGNIEEVIDRINSALKSSPLTKTQVNLTEDTIQSAFSKLSQRFDDKNGGFGRAPKFPSPHNLMFLLRVWKRTGDEWALKMVEQTLLAMRKGGVFDHIGYGFHRYSTDAQWLLPHFEKMLYDQASLMMVYTEAYQITSNPLYADIVQEIYKYLTRNLLSPEGAFYSAEDADSEGVEGKFYLWSYEEIERILKPEEVDIVATYFNIRREGNFLDEVTREKTGHNIPHVTKNTQKIAEALNMDVEHLKKILDNVRENLYSERAKRVRPHRDEKILTDWNGFMIAALAKAGVVLGQKNIIKTAEKAMDFLLDKMLNNKSELYHRYGDGEIAYRAFLDDYVYLIWGLLELYESTFDPHYLEQAKKLSDEMLDYFWDKNDGGLYFTGTYSEELLIRRKDAYDGAMPSGNSVAALNLIRLARLLGDNHYENRAQEIFRAFSDDIEMAHSAYTMMLIGLDFVLGPSFEIVIAGDPLQEDTQTMVKAITQRFLPRKVVLLRGTKEQSKMITRLAPFTKFHEMLQGRATAHVCVDHNCKLPTDDIERMLALIGE
ncbi:thioredoxin domain-containing protein [Candidatus Thorarchaeota archaeon]|nr:MAG: thioredoxin domain-containing protein [Candidatus Thorarchaeota archaeon]